MTPEARVIGRSSKLRNNVRSDSVDGANGSGVLGGMVAKGAMGLLGGCSWVPYALGGAGNIETRSKAHGTSLLSGGLAGVAKLDPIRDLSPGMKKASKPLLRLSTTYWLWRELKVPTPVMPDMS